MLAADSPDGRNAIELKGLYHRLYSLRQAVDDTFPVGQSKPGTRIS